MRIPGITHHRLMEASEARLAAVAREGSPAQSLIARRILEDTRLYRRWESEHGRLMRTVAGEARGLRQAAALRRASFGLVHRKAMFEYLRQHRVTGRDRHAVFSLVHGEQHDYASAVIQEHGNYVRATSSLVCSQYLGLSLMHDRAFGEPLLRYEQLYADYFRTFCGTALSPDEYRTGDTLRTLLPYLKQQLSKLRHAIVAMPQEPDTGFLALDIKAEMAANTQRMHQPFRAAS
jgi:hypothetical protein